MIFDVASHEFRMYFELSEEIPNLDDERFYSLLEAVNRPLWKGCMPFQMFLPVRMLSNKPEVDQPMIQVFPGLLSDNFWNILS